MSSSDKTRDRLIDAARTLFREQGYNATGMAQILEQAGAHSGSLYHFFRSKRNLLAAVLDSYAELLGPAVIDPVFDRVSDPIERVFGVLAGYRKMLADTKFRQGCPIGDLVLELGDADAEIRAKIVMNFTQWRRAIQQCLDDAGDRLPADLDREGLSQFVLTVMEGAVMQSRAYQSLAPFDACIAHLKEYFARLLSGGGRDSADP